MKSQASLGDRPRSCFQQEKRKKCGCWGVSVSLRRKEAKCQVTKKKIRQKMIIVAKWQKTWLNYIVVLGAIICSALLASEGTCT